MKHIGLLHLGADFGTRNPGRDEQTLHLEVQCSYFTYIGALPSTWILLEKCIHFLPSMRSRINRSRTRLLEALLRLEGHKLPRQRNGRKKWQGGVEGLEREEGVGGANEIPICT